MALFIPGQLLIISLKTLRDMGTKGSVIGLDEGKRNLAYELGMHHVSQIIQVVRS